VKASASRATAIECGVVGALCRFQPFVTTGLRAVDQMTVATSVFSSNPVAEVETLVPTLPHNGEAVVSRCGALQQ
jgi:hypothetical protein